MTAAWRSDLDPGDDDGGPRPFRALVVAGSDEHAVYVSGELDLSTAGELRDLLAAVCADDVASVRVDLRDVPFMDSTGLGVLVDAARLVRDLDRSLVVSRPAAGPAHVIDICALRDVLGVTDLEGPAAG